LQPLDETVFHPLELAWKKTVNNWKLENNGERLKKEMFVPLLKKAIDSIDLAFKNDFQTCGFYRFTSDTVNFNVLNKQKEHKNTECNKIDSIKQCVCGATSELVIINPVYLMLTTKQLVCQKFLVHNGLSQKLI